MILDAELVCLDAEGKPDFMTLRSRLARRAGPRGAGGPAATLMIFDPLHVAGRAVHRLPYLARRELLAELGLEPDRT